jgi:hypothetical protein
MRERWTRRQMIFGFLARLLGLSTAGVATAQARSPEPSPAHFPRLVTTFTYDPTDRSWLSRASNACMTFTYDLGPREKP